jgi:hypothetical protein
MLQIETLHYGSLVVAKNTWLIHSCMIVTMAVPSTLTVKDVTNLNFTKLDCPTSPMYSLILGTALAAKIHDVACEGVKESYYIIVFVVRLHEE